MSGTSMSCPHATAAAAYDKSFHPSWSHAAIKSARTTRAYPMTNDINYEAGFAYVAGHINPARVIKPGLVYDAREIDYVEFLCGQGYSSKSPRLVTGDLNYPSFVFSTSSSKYVTLFFHRTVTNVGSPTSTYREIVKAPKGLVVKVKQRVLSFKSHGQMKSFALKVKAIIVGQEVNMLSGSLVWHDGKHQVRSPIVAYDTSA